MAQTRTRKNTRPRYREPSLRQHVSGQFFIKLTGRTLYLGHDQDDARTRRLKILADFEANGRELSEEHRPGSPTGGLVETTNGELTIEGLLALYFKELLTRHPEYVRPDGKLRRHGLDVVVATTSRYIDHLRPEEVIAAVWSRASVKPK